MGRVCVSSCRCCVFVSVVHPVAILSAFFCAICSLLMCVSDASGDHMVETLTLTIHEHLQLHASQYKHNIHHIPYTNTQHTSTPQG